MEKARQIVYQHQVEIKQDYRFMRSNRVS